MELDPLTAAAAGSVCTIAVCTVLGAIRLGDGPHQTQSDLQPRTYCSLHPSIPPSLPVSLSPCLPAFLSVSVSLCLSGCLCFLASLTPSPCVCLTEASSESSSRSAKEAPSAPEKSAGLGPGGWDGVACAYVEPRSGRTFPLDKPIWCDRSRDGSPIPLLLTPLRGITRDQIDQQKRASSAQWCSWALVTFAI